MKAKLLEALANLEGTITSAIPKLAVGVLLVILGLLVAKIVEVTLRAMLVQVRFDRLVEKAGVRKALQRIGMRGHLNVFLPKLAYFMVIVLLAKTVSDVLGLIAVSNAIGAFFGYLPNIVAALLLLILGTTVGQFTGEVVTQAAANAGVDFAQTLGKLITAVVVFIVAMMAISQLGINTEIIRIVTSFVLGAGAIAFGLAFGLGTREIVRNIITGFYARKCLAIGKTLEIAGQTGVLTAVTVTHAILTREGEDLFVPNSIFLEQSSKQY